MNDEFEPQVEVIPEEEWTEDFTVQTVHVKQTIRRHIPLVVVATFLYFILRYVDPNSAFNPVHSNTFVILLVIVFCYSLFVWSYAKNITVDNSRLQSTHSSLKRMYGIFDFLSVIPYLMVFMSLLNMFFVSFSPISGTSMEPNFSDDEAVVFQHINSDYERFDVIIIHVEELSEPYLIKRVIGLPGETIIIDHNDIYVDGELLPQDFIDQSVVETLCVQSSNADYCSWYVPLDSYFVLGDNRDGSAIDDSFHGYSVDSRSFGPVSTDHIFGSVIFTFKDYNILD